MKNASEVKADVRREAMERRREAHLSGRDGAVQEVLAEALKTHAGKVLSGYMPIRTEVNPLPVMAAWQGDICVPVIEAKGQPLVFHRWRQGMTMVPGPFGAVVPVQPEPLTPQVLIVPLLAYDARGYRLGYGGGFYDRTLELLRKKGEVFAIGMAYAEQEADEVPTEPTDQKLDAVATDAGLRIFSR